MLDREWKWVADDYLTKPFEESELIGAIESRIAKSSILKEAQEEKLYNDLASEARVKSIHQLKNFIDDNGEEYRFHLGDSIYREGGQLKFGVFGNKGKCQNS